MSAAAKASAKLEVAKDGVVRIPKTVFEPSESVSSTSAAASSSSASSASPGKQGVRAVTKVVRLDGTVEEVVVGAPPQNPAFQPRQTVWTGKVVTNDKLEVKLKFHLRKGLALTPELEAKKAELEAAEKAEEERVAARAAKFGTGGSGNKGGKGKGKGKGKGGASQGGEATGAFARLGSGEGAAPVAAKPAPVAPPKATPEQLAWYKNRPKGGVKDLGGAEGALTGSKRSAEDAPADGERAAKQAAS